MASSSDARYDHMISNKRVKIYIISFCLCLLLVFVLGGLYYEVNSCLGVQIISEERLESYTEDLDCDITALTYNGERVAADIATNTIYISQSQVSLEHFSNLLGTLKSKNSGQALYIVKNAQLDNLKETVSSGVPLSCIVRDGKSYCRVNVVLTTLPVISLNGDFYGEMHENGYPIYGGSMTFFDVSDPDSSYVNIKTNLAEWHVRGGSSRHLDKKPWKLNLKDRAGIKDNADLLGLGEDDDWILNPMSLDDTKLREKSVIDLWNNDIMTDANDYRMSAAEYVEVIMDGRYQGLYLLQRRIDEKYLRVDKETDIVFKGCDTWTPTNIYEGYEIVHSPYDAEATYQILGGMVNGTVGNQIVIDNFVNVQILIHFFSATDNVGYKNMYYVLKKTDEGYQMHLVPWDMDLTMGVVWKDGYSYDYEMGMSLLTNRIEYREIQALYPELHTMLANRWEELRDTVFASGTQLQQTLEANQQYVIESGAFERDSQRWGFYHDGKDTTDELFRWCEERVQKMDEYYSQ